MPRQPDGSWTPPHKFAGWDDWRPAFASLAPVEARPDALRLARLCERTRENPSTWVTRWAYWLGVFDDGRLVPPDWPDALTPGDWRSLAMFAEHETRATA